MFYAYLNVCLFSLLAIVNCQAGNPFVHQFSVDKDQVKTDKEMIDVDVNHHSNVVKSQQRFGNEIMKSFVGLVKQLQSPKVAVKKTNSTGCSCIRYNCGCCVMLNIPKLDIHQTGCVNVSYLPAPEYGISVTLTIDKYTIFNRTVSARNPPAICADVPYLKKLASLCVRFYDVTLSETSLSMCIKLEATLEGILVDSINLGCVNIPFAQANAQANTLENLWMHLKKTLRNFHVL